MKPRKEPKTFKWPRLYYHHDGNVLRIVWPPNEYRPIEVYSSFGEWRFSYIEKLSEMHKTDKHFRLSRAEFICEIKP